MIETLKFEIECGEKTCASEPGKFCRFFMDNCFGDANCHLFGRVFIGESNWTMRHPNCIKTTVNNDGVIND